MAEEMVDRQARDELSEAIKKDMDGGGNICQLLNVVTKHEQSKDKTVAILTQEFEEYYDDLPPTSGVAAKQTWDFKQRLLLLLASECELEKQSVYFWNIWQVPAFVMCCLILYAFINWEIEWLLFSLFPIWLAVEISNIYLGRQVKARTRDKICINSYPFVGRSQIRRVLSGTNSFQKKNFGGVGVRKAGFARIVFNSFVFVYMLLGRIVSVPFWLIMQVLPANITWYEVQERLEYE